MSTMKEPVFAVGEKVIATGPYMHQITSGKEYEVIRYRPTHWADNGFRYSASVWVIGDFGTPVGGFTYRFRKVAQDAEASAEQHRS